MLHTMHPLNKHFINGPIINWRDSQRQMAQSSFQNRQSFDGGQMVNEMNEPLEEMSRHVIKVPVINGNESTLASDDEMSLFDLGFSEGDAGNWDSNLPESFRLPVASADFVRFPAQVYTSNFEQQPLVVDLLPSTVVCEAFRQANNTVEVDFTPFLERLEAEDVGEITALSQQLMMLIAKYFHDQIVIIKPDPEDFEIDFLDSGIRVICNIDPVFNLECVQTFLREADEVLGNREDLKMALRALVPPTIGSDVSLSPPRSPLLSPLRQKRKSISTNSLSLKRKAITTSARKRIKKDGDRSDSFNNGDQRSCSFLSAIGTLEKDGKIRKRGRPRKVNSDFISKANKQGNDDAESVATNTSRASKLSGHSKGSNSSITPSHVSGHGITGRVLYTENKPAIKLKTTGVSVKANKSDKQLKPEVTLDPNGDKTEIEPEIEEEEEEEEEDWNPATGKPVSSVTTSTTKSSKGSSNSSVSDPKTKELVNLLIPKKPVKIKTNSEKAKEEADLVGLGADKLERHIYDLQTLLKTVKHKHRKGTVCPRCTTEQKLKVALKAKAKAPAI